MSRRNSVFPDEFGPTTTTMPHGPAISAPGSQTDFSGLYYRKERRERRRCRARSSRMSEKCPNCGTPLTTHDASSRPTNTSRRREESASAARPDR